MRGFAFLMVGGAAAILGGLLYASPANAAQGSPQNYHIICIAQNTPARIAHGIDVISETFATSGEARARHLQVTERFKAHAAKAGHGEYRYCNMYSDHLLATDRHAKAFFEGYKIGSKYTLVGGDWVSVYRANLPAGWEDLPLPNEKKDAKKSGPSKANDSVPKKLAEDTPPRPDSGDTPATTKTRADYEAEYQAKLAAHQAEVADFERKKKEREEEIARQNAAHAAAQEAAARKKSAHARLIEEHMKRQMDYEAARNRHTACVNGDKSACDAIAAGAPATAAKMADAGEASTATDATRCVTSPQVFPSQVWKNAVEARVVNNCETSVDIVLCLNRPEGWHCGVKMGVSPGAGMSWDARNGNGEVYWDARVMGSTKPLGRPN